MSLLGSGGMGTVWRADHLGLNAPVAVKLLSAELGAAPEAIARFQREAQSAATLRSPHVVQILDHGIDEALRVPFIVMELLEGQSLAERLQREGRLSPDETARIVAQVARALTRAHELGIVHRDLKPGNVYLVRNEDEWMAKVLDFGIAKWQPQIADASALTGTNAVMGTPYYMSPEQLAGARFVDHRTDLWALAVMAYESLTGTRPFMAENVMGVAIRINAAEVPPPSSFGFAQTYDAFFARALARAPEQRFQSARELADELRRVTSSAGSDALIREKWAVLAVAPTESDANVARGSEAVAAVSGPSSRTVTAVEAAKSPTTERRSRTPWVLAGLAGVAGLGAVALLTLSGESDVPAGLPSAAGALLSQAAPPPKVQLPEPEPVKSLAPPASNTAPKIDVVQSAPAPPPPPAPAAIEVPVSRPAATPARPSGVNTRPATAQPERPAKPPAPAPTRPNVYDTRH